MRLGLDVAHGPLASMFHHDNSSMRAALWLRQG